VDNSSLVPPLLSVVVDLVLVVLVLVLVLVVLVVVVVVKLHCKDKKN